MILLSLAVGWLVGILLNWIADYLPRFAASRPAVPPPTSPKLVCGVGQALSAVLRKTKPSRRAVFHRTNALVEIVSMALFGYLSWSFAGWQDFALKALIFSFLILVAVIDLKYRLVLNVLLYPAMIITLLVRVAQPGTNWAIVIMGAGFGLAIFAMTAFLRPGEIGLGDVKLATFIGLLLGFPNVIWALLLTVLSGGLAAVFLIKWQGWNKKAVIPYAPFLSLGALLGIIYNPMTWFMR